MKTCENCGANTPHNLGLSSDGRYICCAHCLFNPLGCRYKYGNYHEPETRDYGDIYPDPTFNEEHDYDDYE